MYVRIQFQYGIGFLAKSIGVGSLSDALLTDACSHSLHFYRHPFFSNIFLFANFQIFIEVKHHARALVQFSAMLVKNCQQRRMRNFGFVSIF